MILLQLRNCKKPNAEILNVFYLSLFLRSGRLQTNVNKIEWKGLNEAEKGEEVSVVIISFDVLQANLRCVVRTTRQEQELQFRPPVVHLQEVLKIVHCS